MYLNNSGLVEKEYEFVEFGAQGCARGLNEEFRWERVTGTELLNQSV